MGYGDQIAKMSDLGFRLPQFHPDIEAICERKLKDEGQRHFQAPCAFESSASQTDDLQI